MKKMITLFAALMALSSQASASWYQGFCSNGEGTVKTASGHNENFVRLTVRTWNQGTPTDRTLELGHDDYDQTTVRELELSKKESSSCGSEPGFGFWSSETVTYEKITFRLKNGRKFPEGTVGASQDRTTVQAHLICEMHMNSETMCP